VVNVGAGASRRVDGLLDYFVNDVTLLDLSNRSFDVVRAPHRAGRAAEICCAGRHRVAAPVRL